MHNKYDFLSNLISLIYSNEYPSTIIGLSKNFNISIEFMRHTFVTLLKNKFIASCLEGKLDNSSISIMDEFFENPDTTTKKIKEGHYDYIEWSINTNFLFLDDSILLPFSSIELSELANSLGVDISSISDLTLYEKKNISVPVPNKVINNLKIIQQSIEEKKSITFRYRYKDGKSISVSTFPVQIISSINDNWIYMYTSDEKIYRLDKIINDCVENKSSSLDSAFSIKTIYKYAWGLPSKDEFEPTNIKIRVKPTTKNIIKKIKDDLYLRKNLDSYKFYKDGDYFIYEDKILGLKSFKRWIRSYGSSMIVLEPMELGDSLHSRANEILEYYKISDEWAELI